MRLMALDVGDKTIGVAVCDELGITTTGVETVWRRGHAHDFPELTRLLEEWQPERLVVGLPMNMDGTEGPRAVKTRRFAGECARRLGRPVVLWDERLSTWEADGILRDRGVPPQKRKAVIDQIAAEIILRSYLDAGAPEVGPHGPVTATPEG